MKLLAAGWMACLLLLQDPAPLKPVTVRVDTLFGSGQNNQWHTLILEVVNQTASDQEFQIAVDLGYSDQALRREKFAAKVRKRLFFYLPADSYSNRVVVKVTDSAGRELLSQGQELALSSSGYGSGGPVLVPVLMDRPPAQFPGGYIAKVVPEELFPDRWIALDGIPTIYIRDYKIDSLLPAQRAALLEWVRRGGLVILYAGSNRDWLTSPAVKEIAPVMLGESEELESLPEMEGKFGRFRERTKFARHKFLNGEPLPEFLGGAVQFRVGSGRVIVVPFDLERAPFDSWPGTQSLRLSLGVGTARADPRSDHESNVTPLLSRDPSLIHRAATVNVNRLPPFMLLLVLTLTYLVAVGPVNFLVLRRLRMTVRLVFTIPAISAIFLGVVVISGYVLRGTSTVTFDICVMDAGKGSAFAFERHYLSIFSPAPRNYDIVFGEGETGLPQEVDLSDEYRYSYGRRGYRHDSYASGGVVYDQTDRWTLRGVAFQQWQTRAFVGDAVRPIGGGVKFTLGTDLEVTNQTPYTIRRGWAIEKEAVFQAVPFGEVPPGATRKFPVNPDPDAHRRYDWMDADSLEERLVGGWLFGAARARSYRAFLLCVLDRLPDEIAVDAYRSSQSERLCLLQVGSEP